MKSKDHLQGIVTLCFLIRDELRGCHYVELQSYFTCIFKLMMILAVEAPQARNAELSYLCYEKILIPYCL